MNVRSLGSLLILLGVGSFVLNHFNYEFKLLAWVDHWGPSTGTMIRVGCIVLGAALWLLSPRSAER
ncbi:hypothetical protein [Lysobacter arvi]|uniref:DUF378 domain-containing protein n=1 Tax=Lysobacter arvi TaxID=3038776 RepID=A0ABU1CBH5_9GAMM|nr:hypothetical protein [Lysobacter arvi]MDR0181764.1 hypothetical protein [Lysobacter arvi]